MIDINPDTKFEDLMRRLEEIVNALESPDLSLEDGMRLYQEGAQCSRICREKLDKARHQLEIWQNDELESVDIEFMDQEELDNE